MRHARQHRGALQLTIGTWTMGLFLASSPARAEVKPSSSESAIAEQLYQRGRQQMAERQYRDACASFAESLRHDSGTGALLNLALCHEAVGELAGAWVEFREALLAARREARSDRVTFAQTHLAAIEPRLAHLTLAVPKDAQEQSWLVSLDGKALGPAAWRIPLPVDAGSHEVVARTTDGRQWRAVSTLREGESRTVAMPAIFIGAGAITAGSDSTRSVRSSRVAPGDARHTAGLIAGTAGVVAIGVGTFYGFRAFSLWHDRDRECPAERCSPEGVRDGDRAGHAANVANWALGSGAVAIGAGALLLFWPHTGGPSASPAANPPLSFQVVGTGRVVIGGVF